MWEEIRRIEARTRVASRDAHGEIGRSTGFLQRDSFLTHCRIRAILYVLFMFLCGVACISAIYLSFTETFFGGALLFAISIALLIWTAFAMGIDGDLLRYYRAIVIGYDDNHLVDKLKVVNEQLRIDIDELVEQSRSWNSSGEVVPEIKEISDRVPSIESISKAQSSVFQFDLHSTLNLGHQDISKSLIGRIETALGKVQAVSKQHDSCEKALEDEKKSATAQRAELKKLHSEIEELRKQIVAKDSDEVRRTMALHAAKENIDELTRKDKNNRQRNSQLLKENKHLASAIEEERQLHIQTRENSLSSTRYIDLVRHLTEKLNSMPVGEQRFTSLEKQSIAGMYAAMHERLPDMQRVKELALVPHETIRAQQVETIVSHYSALITAAENDDSLSSDEREDKANAYRMARESELQAFHGGG